jgi:hypothetical protein
VVFMSRAADERLWAEMLNLGAFDLLMKPLLAAEVGWVIDSAVHRRRALAGPECAGSGGRAFARAG